MYSFFAGLDVFWGVSFWVNTAIAPVIMTRTNRILGEHYSSFCVRSPRVRHFVPHVRFARPLEVEEVDDRSLAFPKENI